MTHFRSAFLILLMSLFALPALAQDEPMSDSLYVAPLDSIRNWLPISDVLFTGGQVGNDQVPLLAEKGVQTVINLATPRQEVNGQEGFHVASSGMTYINIPVEWQEPTLDDVDQFFRVMNANEGRTVYVHCVANYRGAVFTYLYRVLAQGVPEEEAREDLLKVWDPAESETWHALIQDALSNPRFDGE